MYRTRFDGMTVVALAFLVFLGFNVLRDQGFFSGWFDSSNNPVTLAAGGAGWPAPQSDLADLVAGDQELTPLTADTINAGSQTAPTPTRDPAYDPTVLIYPYVSYLLTQGPHGADYGHMAIDLQAGKGATILSPLWGIVTAVFIDQYNNTNLIIENERYVVTMMHGDYTVATGQHVTPGDPVGAESNNGYTLDAYGQPCAGRDCGWHTHLNVYDKTLMSNVNPMDVLKPAPQTSQ